MGRGKTPTPKAKAGRKKAETRAKERDAPRASHKRKARTKAKEREP